MKKKLALLITFSILFSFIVSGSAETKSFKKFQLLPSDDSVTDKEFSVYIEKFKKAVKDKNLTSLKKLTADDVQYTIESQGGVKGLIKFWELDKNPDKSHFWYQIDKVLSMGSAYYDDEKTSHAYPYLFVKFPADYDSFEYIAATGKKVNVRKAPGSKSSVIETLDYEILKSAGVEENPGRETINGIDGTWVKVITSKGKEGYIFSHYVHSPIGYRAIFEKRKKGWLFTAFVSGD